MKATRPFLYSALQNNVVELRFARRHMKPGWKGYRRMLCTNAMHILNSAPGRLALHFKPPSQPPPFNPNSFNLVTTWDLFWQEYRNINCDQCDVITMMPVVSKEDIDKFWNYFNMYLESMSPGDKVNFMNK